MTERSIEPASALEELASLFHRLAVAQIVPPAATAFGDAELVAELAARMTPEAVQLAYQIVVQGRADLALAPDEAMGFSMTLLRLLAFRPAGPETSAPPPGTVASRAPGPASAPARRQAPAPVPPAGARETVAPASATAAATATATAAATATAVDGSPATGRVHRSLPDDSQAWPAFVASLELTGVAAQLAAQTELKGVAGNVVTLALPVSHKHLADRSYADKFKAALEVATGRKLLLAFEVGTAAEASLAARDRRERAERKLRDEAQFRDEPFVREVLERFDAKIRPDSIKPVS
jgi:DNA polymerase-3 subunit gamma/tau